MLNPGTVKAGDEVVYKWDGFEQIVKIERITSENEVISVNGSVYRAGVIVLENELHFTPEGMPIGICAYNEELYPLAAK